MRVRIAGINLVSSSLGVVLMRVGADVLLENLNSSHAGVTAGLEAGRVTTGDEPVGAIMMTSLPVAIAGVVTWTLEHHPEAMITDIGSAKSSIIRAVTATSDRPERCISDHPTTGSQLTGPLTASADPLTDRIWVITPQVGNNPEDVGLAHRPTRLCGTCVVRLDANPHNEAVVQVSHVPHLMNILTTSYLRGVPGEDPVLMRQDIQDMTHIASSDPGLWRQIITTSSVAIWRELSGVAADFEYLIGALGQAGPLGAFLALRQHGVMTLRGKHGQAPKGLAAVAVEVPNEPRALTRLFGDIGDFRFNVEDSELTHDAVQEAGCLSISVEHLQTERFREDPELRDQWAWPDWEGI